MMTILLRFSSAVGVQTYELVAMFFMGKQRSNYNFCYVPFHDDLVVTVLV